MPLYDFQCECGHEVELFFPMVECPGSVPCTACGNGSMRKIISIGGSNIMREEAPWLRSVLDVVDKDSTAPHVRQFLQDPTRRNYHNWMSGEGIRPMENGERRSRPKVDRSRIREEGKRMFFGHCRSGTL